MAVPITLVVALLRVQSSYLGNIEQSAQDVPDTVQFCFAATIDWRTRTFAMDHDIHTHRVTAEDRTKRLSADWAVTNTRKNYGDILARIEVIKFVNPADPVETRKALTEHGLSGSLEFGESGLVFYNPDGGHYHSQSEPK